MTNLALIALIAYLLGSIPFGYLLMRFVRGTDVRNTGSGNIGATNVARSDPKLGIATLLLDAMKGYAAVAFALWWNSGVQNAQFTHAEVASMAAAASVAGHMFPVWLRFKGGKGVATGVGAFFALAPRAVGLALVLFIVVVAISRYISLGSILASAAFPVALYFVNGYDYSWLALILTALTSLFIIVKHRENIRRLVAGTENRFGARKTA
jgi:acyl phosphate:glycerol-3-phosphate acyltransferase